ncbi:MAG: BON domain-containing protein [Acidobacteria bacterium]|nr:BON domain-containing protein [Acidobacteriota bacterium]
MKRTLNNTILKLVVAGATLLPSFAANNIPEERIVKKVRTELLTMPFLSIFDNLSYRIDGETIYLYGQVIRPTLKSDAANRVKRLEGVTKVVNEIEVLPLSPYDDRVRLAVARAVYGVTALNRYALGANPSIRIVVKNGNVTLEGVVANEMDRNIANLMANGVFGVFSVTNNLQVEKGRA